MEFDKVLKKRRSVRRYKANPVPRESVLKVLEAARIAPSAAHRQPWHFIVVEDAEMRAKLAGRQAWAAEAPVTVVAFADEEASPSWYSNDVGIAFEHLVLAATDLELGTCWMGLTRRDAEIRKLLRTPKSLKVVAMTPLGVPDEEPAPKERKSLDEIVSWETYGRQAE
jgi:nitroreductase